MGRSDSFSKIEDEVKKINKDDLLNYVEDAYNEITDRGHYFSSILGNNNEKFLAIIATSISTGIRIAVMDDGVIGKEEEDFLKEFTRKVLEKPFNDEAKKNISKPISNSDFLALKLVLSLLVDIKSDWGINYLRFIMGIAYCDGKFEDKTADMLDSLFDFSSDNITKSGNQPSKDESRNVELENRLYRFVQRTDGGSIETIMNGLQESDEVEVKKSLEKLVSIGKITRMDFNDGPWYVRNNDDGIY